MLSEPPPAPVELTPQPVERRKGVAIAAAGIAILVGSTIAIGIEAHGVVRDEAQLWQIASSERGTREDWQRYVDFAAGARDGLRGTIASTLTAVSVRAPLAAENVVVASAERASLDADDAALCAIRDAHPDTRGGDLAAVLLRSRFQTRLEAFAASALDRGVRPETSDVLVRAARVDDPCHPLGMITMTRTTDATSTELDHALPFGRASLRDHIELDDRPMRDNQATIALSDALEDAIGIPLSEGDEGGPLAIAIVSTVRTEGRFAAHHGTTVPGLALDASFRLYARGRPPSPLGEPDVAIDLTVEPRTSFALAIAQATSADELDAVYTRMLAELDAGLISRVRTELGLPRSPDPDGWSGCDAFDPLPFGGVVHGDTRASWDNDVGSCSLEYEERSEDDGSSGDDEPLANGEVRYRMVVAERARIAIQTETSDERPMVVYVATACGPGAELACRYDALEDTLDPGVYSVVVDETQGGSGRFDVLARVRTDAASMAACRDAVPLTIGTTIHGDTTRASDSLQSDCGGVGSHEQVYALDVSEPSRLRCAITADFAATIDVRDDCVSDSLACVRQNESLRAELAPGRHFVVVDGATHDRRGTYALTCELASASGVSAPTVDLVSPMLVDTFRARSDAHGSCGSTNGPERTVRVDVAMAAHLHFAATGLATTMYLEDGARELGCHMGTLDVDVTPGTYTLVVDGDAASFGTRTITLTQTDLDAMCTASTPLAIGPSTGTTARGTTSFRGTCVGDGAESMQRLVLATRSHVVIRGRLASFAGGIYVRRACGDAQSEVACARDERGDVAIDVTLDAGSYEVFVDGASAYASGAYALDVAIDAI